MNVIFKVASGHLAGKEIRLPLPKCLFGRAQECFVRINSEAVSRRHCSVDVKDGRLYVQDMNSRNGTFVNGSPIAGVCELKNGDQLGVGHMVFEVHIGPTPHRAEKRPTASKNIGETFSAGNSALSDSEISQYMGDSETRPIKIEESREITIPHPTAAPPEQNENTKPALPSAKDGINSQPKIPGSWSQKKRASSTETAAEEALNRILRGY